MDSDREVIIDLMQCINLLSSYFLSICDIFLSICDILLIECDNEVIKDLMLYINLFSCSFLELCDIFLSICDILLSQSVIFYHCHNESIIRFKFFMRFFIINPR